MNHSPTIRLSNARRARDFAVQECPHWDYESDGPGGHDCCAALEDAERELRLAREAAAKAAEGV